MNEKKKPKKKKTTTVVLHINYGLKRKGGVNLELRITKKIDKQCRETIASND